MSELAIRPITKNDIASCLDIYNYEVVNGVATLDLEPRTLTEWQEWYEAHQTSEHCIFCRAYGRCCSRLCIAFTI